MRMAGIGVQVHYIPVTNQPYYRSLGVVPEDFPEAQAYYERAMSLPLFPDLTDSEQDRVVEILLDLVDKEKNSVL
jgi:dTDP-4-amino-4,6-dideoxygalactose transaminase